MLRHVFHTRSHALRKNQTGEVCQREVRKLPVDTNEWEIGGLYGRVRWNTGLYVTKRNWLRWRNPARKRDTDDVSSVSWKREEEKIKMSTIVIYSNKTLLSNQRLTYYCLPENSRVVRLSTLPKELKRSLFSDGFPMCSSSIILSVRVITFSSFFSSYCILLRNVTRSFENCYVTAEDWQSLKSIAYSSHIEMGAVNTHP